MHVDFPLQDHRLRLRMNCVSFFGNFGRHFDIIKFFESDRHSYFGGSKKTKIFIPLRNSQEAQNSLKA